VSLDSDYEEEPARPFRVTPGFIGFVALLLLPAIVALGVYFGAWLVADEVHAAAASASGQGFAVAGEQDVADWKKALVGICPAH
jgi:hypothetical protein